MVVRTLYDPLSGEAIDRGLVVWFEAPHTETGETMAELHLHGGRAVVGAALEAIGRLGFCRLAEPGEFTRRAFEHGKLDLTEAEAIADLVAAETEQQRRQALQQMDGALHRLYEDWRTLGLRTLAHLEAAIDFPDEDLPAGHRRRGARRHRAAAGRDRRPSRRSPRRAPARGRAHRHHRPAQRRQVLAAQSAGAPRRRHRVGDRRHDARRHRGPSRSRRLAGGAGRHRGLARVAAMPSSRKACAAPARAPPRPICACWCSMRRATGGRRAATSSLRTENWDEARDIVVVNKVDLAAADDADIVPLSATSGAGLPELLARLERSAGLLMEEGAAAPPLTRARHREALVRSPCRPRPRAGGAGDRLGRRGPAPRLARHRPHHRHGAGRGTAGRHLPRLLYRQMKTGGVITPPASFNPVEPYWITISTRRFCGSRTLSPV